MRSILWIVPLAASLAATGPAIGQTSQATLLDRIQIEEMVVDYYSQLGQPKKTKSFADSYTDDAEMILGNRSIRGKAAIEAIYASFAPPPGRPPRAPMTVLLSNPRITVTGSTAHGEFIYTGIVADAPDKAPRLHEQGREIDEFVKLKGVWKIRKRTIISDANAGMDAR